jgi:hypothetical protein
MQQTVTEEVNFPKLFIMISELNNESNKSYSVFSESYQAIIDGKENFNAVIAQIDVMERNKQKLSNCKM